MGRKTLFDDLKDRILIEEWNKGSTEGVISDIIHINADAIRNRIATLRKRGVSLPSRKHVAHNKGKTYTGRKRQGKAGLAQAGKEKIEPQLTESKARKLVTIAVKASTVIKTNFPSVEPSDKRWVPILNTRFHSCRYTDDQHNRLFCNAPGYPWCNEHRAVVFTGTARKPDWIPNPAYKRLNHQE